MMSIYEAAKYLGVSAFALRRMARERKVPAGKIGRQWRFRKEDLDLFLQQQYEGQASAA